MRTSRARTFGCAALAACMAGDSAAAMDVPFGSLAMNLECLGAEFYSFAAFGKGLSEELRGGGPPSVGGRKANISAPLQAIVAEMAEEKAAHVGFLRDVLEDAAPPCPAMDIGPAFAAAADAAAGEVLIPPFSPYDDDTLFLHAAFLLQDVFATVYAGVATGDPKPGLENTSTLFAAADSYFAGAVRVLLLLKDKAGNPTPFGSIGDLVALMSDLRDSEDGPKDLDQGVGNATAANVLPADEDGLPYTREAAQGLAILYLGGMSSGGFFPEGITMGMMADTPEAADEMMMEPEPEVEPTPEPAMMEPEVEPMPVPSPPTPTPEPPMMEPEAEPIVEETIQVDVPLAVDTADAGCSGTCEYRVNVDMVWNARTHPVDYPAGVAHWSPFYMVTHDETYFMWRFGEPASAGIQQIAEDGLGFDFMDEVAACGESCSDFVQVACDPFSGTCTGSGTITATPDRPFLSLASMVAPSPDWFTGVDAWPLCVGGEWIAGREADVDAYDAGTDSGPTFLSPNQPDSSVVTNFRDTMPLSDSIFFDPATGAMLTVGNIEVELVGCE